jgi:hypothetical protein
MCVGAVISSTTRQLVKMDPTLMDSEIARLKREVSRLQAQLKAQQTPEFTDLRGNYEFVTDLSRYCEGIVSEQNVRKKWRLSENVWTELGEDEAFIEVIKRCREARCRNGAAAREKAQKVFVKAPDVLDEILNDKNISPRHRIEASRELRATANVGPEAHSATEERYVIQINIGEDYKLKIDQPIRPIPGTIEQESLLIEDNDGKSV